MNLEAAPFAWAVSTQPYPEETQSGDRHVVVPYSGGVLVALIDALGHGDDAANVADVAAQILMSHPQENIASLLERCHLEMRGTRGAAISLASFNWYRRHMQWLGVGNVVGTLLRSSFPATPLLVRSGVVGDRLPELTPCEIPFSGRATLILASDGVRTEFTENSLPALYDPQRQADDILNRYGRCDDDATVLVFRYSDEI